MIFYFSGTGNSEWVALQMSKVLNEPAVHIGKAMTAAEFEYTLADGERVGFVFPVHSWGPAPIVMEFLHHLKVNNYNKKNGYCYAVLVCGDDVGLAAEMFEKKLPEPLALKTAFSVQMPNNYILLPGFDVDGKTLELTKLINARSRVAEITRAVLERRTRYDVVTGGMPWLKSRVVYPLYKRLAMSDRKFTADAAKCTSCRKCERVCPVGNIDCSAGAPKWGGKCEMCLACIHRCPVRAIEYGSISRKKGRYRHPDAG